MDAGIAISGEKMARLYTFASNLRFNSTHLSHQALTDMTLRLIDMMYEINPYELEPAIIRHIEKTAMSSPMKEKLKHLFSQLAEVYKPGRDEEKIAATIARSFALHKVS